MIYIYNAFTQGVYGVCMVKWVRAMVFNDSINNIPVISWRSVFLLVETGVPGENHRPVASH